MHFRIGFVAGVVVLATTLHGQPPQAQSVQGQEPPIVIHRIDLVPSGSIFSMDEPKLQGDTYVFRILPERTVERLPKAKVKKITRRTRDFEKAVVFQVDLNPSGRILASEEPVKKGSAYVLNTWKGGTLLSVKQADVKKITRLTGMEAFRAEEEELGVVLMEGELNFKGGVVPDASQGSGAAPPPGQAPAAGNWTYTGVPGKTDGYAPASATVSRPGDVPRLPTPGRPPN